MTRRAHLFAVVLSSLAFVPARPALALANRVFVSAKSGNNANACDNLPTPCQTLAGAVVQLNPGGEAIVLDSGGYGPVTITQSVTIEAAPGVTAFVHPPSGDAITINAGGGDTVVLRGLVLNGGPGSGVLVNTVGSLYVENCVISGFASGGIYVGTPSKSFVKDTTLRNNGSVALWFITSGSTASIDHCRIENNTFGVFTSTGAKATLRDSVVAGSTQTGVGAQQAGSELNVENCVIANNLTGVIANTDTATVRVSNTAVTNNGTGLVFSVPAVLLSRSNNTVEGNTTNGAFSGTYTAK